MELNDTTLNDFESLTGEQKNEVRKLHILNKMSIEDAVNRVKNPFDAYRDLTGAKIVKITGAFVFPSINGLIVENGGRYYKLTSEKLIDVEEIEYKE